MTVYGLIEQLEKIQNKNMNVAFLDSGSIVLMNNIKIESDGYFNKFENKWKNEKVLVIK